MDGARVLLLTRSGCHLCDEARDVVSAVCAEAGTDWYAVDVDTEPGLRRQWGDHVPVVFADQALHGYWFVDGTRLREELHGPARPMSPSWRPPAPQSQE